MKKGINRTGIGMSPLDAKLLVDGASQVPMTHGKAYDVERLEEARTAEPLGSMPPPTSIKGVAKTVAAIAKGGHPVFFLDKLGERLAFERTGVRLYEMLITKHDAVGSFPGGPSRAELVSILEDEHRHFGILKQMIEGLGADPTAITPCAEVAAVASAGLVQVLADPRTTLAEGLEAILIAELADNAAWDLLLTLATELGRNDLVETMRVAEDNERRHLESVQGWLAAYALAAGRIGGAEQLAAGQSEAAE